MYECKLSQDQQTQKNGQDIQKSQIQMGLYYLGTCPSVVQVPARDPNTMTVHLRRSRSRFVYSLRSHHEALATSPSVHFAHLQKVPSPTVFKVSRLQEEVSMAHHMGAKSWVGHNYCVPHLLQSQVTCNKVHPNLRHYNRASFILRV